MKDIRFICNVLEIQKKIKYPDFQAMTLTLLVMLPLMNGMDRLGANKAQCIQVVADGDVSLADFQHLGSGCCQV